MDEFIEGDAMAAAVADLLELIKGLPQGVWSPFQSASTPSSLTARMARP